MTRTKLFAAFVAILLLTASVAIASAQTPNFTQTVARVSAAPTLDGKLTDRTWLEASQKGGKVVVDLNHTADRLVEYPRVAYLAYDDTALYVAFVAYVPDPDKLVTFMPTHSHNDEVEIFIGTDRSGYHQFIITASGDFTHNARDSMLTAPVPEIDFAVEVSDIKWIVEAAIPFDAFGGAPAPGDEWVLNLNGRQVGAGDMWLAWNPTYGGFHNADRFATIVFGE